MRYLKDDDNRYRVRFMRATEGIMDALTVEQFISYLEENAEFEDTTVEYLDGKGVDCKVYCLHETKTLFKEFLVTEDGRVFYWLSPLQKIELVDREETVVAEVSVESEKGTMMKKILMRLVKDFNEYSELVALNYSKKKEGACDESTLQWNRGNLYQIEEYLKEAADNVGVTLDWECKEHEFGFDDWKRVLEYRTVKISLQDWEKLGA